VTDEDRRAAIALELKQASAALAAARLLREMTRVRAHLDSSGWTRPREPGGDPE
jgi:hypothetical protein